MPVEFSYNGGKADFDVCWSHRQNAVNSTNSAEAYSFGSFLGVGKPMDDDHDHDGSGDASMPRGVLQFEDMDWTNFYMDVGSL